MYRKGRCQYLKHFIISTVAFVLSIAFFCGIYIGVFNASASDLGILWTIFILYGLCLGIGWNSMDEIKSYEQKAVHFGLTEKDHPKILLFSLTSLSSTYLCVALVSLIPLTTYHVWFITVFPCIFLNCLPAITVLGEYYGLTRKKFPFVMWFIVITVMFSLLGILVSHLFLE